MLPPSCCPLLSGVDHGAIDSISSEPRRVGWSGGGRGLEAEDWYGLSRLFGMISASRWLLNPVGLRCSVGETLGESHDHAEVPQSILGGFEDSDLMFGQAHSVEILRKDALLRSSLSLGRLGR